MLYKTMALELLQQRPQLHDQLRKQRMLLTAMEQCARELKSSHEAWTDSLAQADPGRDRRQISSEALEIALQELEASLPHASPTNADEAFPLDAAMAFLRRARPA